MRFLRVFRWILLVIAIIFGLITGFFVYCFLVPESTIGTGIQEYLTQNNLERATVLLSYGIPFAVCFVLFLIFHIVCVSHKKKEEVPYNTSSSNEKGELLFASSLSHNKKFSSLNPTKDYVIQWKQDDYIPTVMKNDDELSFLGNRTVLVHDLSGGNIVYYVTDNKGNPVYPIITVFGHSDDEGCTLVVSKRTIKNDDYDSINQVQDYIDKQVVREVMTITPAKGDILYVYSSDTGFQELQKTISNSSIKKTFKDWKTDGCWIDLEVALCSLVETELEQQYMVKVMDDLHKH